MAEPGAPVETLEPPTTPKAGQTEGVQSPAPTNIEPSSRSMLDRLKSLFGGNKGNQSSEPPPISTRLPFVDVQTPPLANTASAPEAPSATAETVLPHGDAEIDKSPQLPTERPVTAGASTNSGNPDQNTSQ